MNNFDEHCNELVKRWLHYPDQVKTEKQEKRDYALAMERRKNFKPKELPKKVFMNHNMKWYLKTEITEEMELREEEWAISYLDYIK